MTTEPTEPDPVPAPTITPTADPQPAPSAPAQPSPWPLRFDVVILVLLLALSFLLASFTASNSDLWMHRAVGKLLSEDAFTFGVDPFSWATEASGDRPAVYWVHHSWLFSWIVNHVINLVGGAGIVIGKAVLFTATIALLSRIGWNAANRWFILFCLVMAALAAAPRLLVQPIVVSFFFLALTLFILYRVGMFAAKAAAMNPVIPDPSAVRRGENADMRWLWALPPLFALWANLDHWFILGPIVLALCWAGSGLAKWYPNGNPVPGRAIGHVLGVSLLACLANPHQVRVFELPPELAYVVVSAADPIGLPLPDALVAGGRTLKELQKAEYGIWTLSTLSSQYCFESRIGMNIAGWSVYFLLVLGLASFTLTALVKPQPSAPVMQVNRFLLWLVFGVLGLMLYRLIPFFALIAAPLTAMTLGEFLLWQQDSNAVSQDKRDRGLQMARFASVPFLLLLLGFAWPGWLTGGFDNFSPHRVAWDMRADGSVRETAKTLHELKKSGECQNVFNSSFEAANYLPWYAPDVKYFMDTRFSLYARDVKAFLQVRKALLDPSKPAEEWRTLFEERKIDQAIIDSPLAGKAGTPPRVIKWWLDAEQWRERYGDSQVTLFSWAGADKSWDADTARHDWNRRAFGPISADRRPPAQGIDAPQPVSQWTLYADGLGLTPVGVAQCKLLNTQWNLESQIQQLRVVGLKLGGIVGQHAIPGGFAESVPTLLVTPNENLLVRAVDLGPPAFPILMVRAGRRAVAQGPTDPDTFSWLTITIQMLRDKQEDHWIPYYRPSQFSHPSPLRDRLRQVQLVAGGHALVHLAPDSFEHQLNLANLYLQVGLRDSALEHMQFAERALIARLAAGGKNVPRDPKERDQAIKSFHDRNVAPLDQAVRERLAKFKDKSDQKPLEQAAFAYRGNYEEQRGKDRVPVSMGLGNKAIEVLGGIDPNELKAEDALAYLSLRFELLLDLGRIDIASANLKDVRARLPDFVFAQYQLFCAGALGDYKTMDEALVTIEKAMRDGMKPIPAVLTKRQLEAVPARFIVPTLGWQATATTAAIAHLPDSPMAQFFGTRKFSEQQHNYLFNAMTLRGIVALESGDTQRAREIFEATLKEAGAEHPFADRPIALRYLDLLKENK